MGQVPESWLANNGAIATKNSVADESFPLASFSVVHGHNDALMTELRPRESDMIQSRTLCSHVEQVSFKPEEVPCEVCPSVVWQSDGCSNEAVS